jgi:hypothetical protein
MPVDVELERADPPGPKANRALWPTSSARSGSMQKCSASSDGAGRFSIWANASPPSRRAATVFVHGETGTEGADRGRSTA